MHIVRQATAVYVGEDHFALVAGNVCHPLDLHDMAQSRSRLGSSSDASHILVVGSLIEAICT